MATVGRDLRSEYQGEQNHDGIIEYRDSVGSIDAEIIHAAPSTKRSWLFGVIIHRSWGNPKEIP
jgi:hypothetical protein